MGGQVFPDPLRNFWNKWELHGAVFVSIVCQLILLHLGNLRRKQTNTLCRFLVWSSYIIADKVAIFALGVIVGKLGGYYDKCEEHKADINPQLMSLWASMFLVHLGGPGTITAYTLEDNELWQRHLIGLVVQTGLVIYIILLSWERSSTFSHLSVVMLIIGFFKYGERTLSLYSSSISRHRNSLVSYITRLDSHGNNNGNDNYQKNRTFYERLLHPFLRFFVSMFADVVLSIEDRNKSISLFKSISASDAFAIVEAELHLAYEFFYTKASIVKTCKGLIFHVIAIFVNFGSIFYLLRGSKKIHTSTVDWIFSIMLMFALQYSMCSEFLSHGFICFVKQLAPRLRITGRQIRVTWRYLDEERERGRPTHVIHFEDPDYAKMVLQLMKLTKRGSWSDKLGQCNLLSLYTIHYNVISGIPLSANKLVNLLPASISPVSMDLKKIIFDRLKNKSNGVRNRTFRDGVRERDLTWHMISAEFQWTKRFGFHESILTWHIATDLCYHFDDDESNRKKSSLECKQLSDYMFFLLVKRRYMLPVGAGLVRLYDTCVEAIKNFHCLKQTAGNQSEAFKMLVESGGIDLSNNHMDEGTKSLFLPACKLAKSLLEKDRESLWNLLADVWVEILSYAAAHCRVDNHAQQLRRGGEFLSHVWLLQAHMGLVEQLQVMEDDDDVENDMVV